MTMTAGHRLLGLLVAWLASTAAIPALAGEDFMPLAAHYLEARGDGHAPARPVDWYLIRKPQQVEIARPGYVELWERDVAGAVSWQRIYHEDRKRITYTPAELRGQKHALSWTALNSVLDFEQVIANLHPVGKMKFMERPATRYVGKIGSEEIDLVWLDEEKLPGRMLRREFISRTASSSRRFAASLHPIGPEVIRPVVATTRR